ncbi:unnamed protein product [Merluccius merluccius]
MLLALRRRVQTFAERTGQNLLEEARQLGNEARLGHQFSGAKSLSGEQERTAQFRAVVEEMENYLHPIISQFDFSHFRNPRKQSLPLSAQGSGRLRDKEEKQRGSAKDQPACPPRDPGECVVVLADQWLQELPLEALSVLRGRGVSSVSRDFSLQLLHARLHPDQHDKVEGDNKKETKGGKAAKGKGDQSRAIKVGHAFSWNILLNSPPPDIVDPYDDYGNYEGVSLAERMQVILDNHSQLGASLWDGFMGSSTHIRSLAQVEQLLGRCSGFIYLGTERFMANVPPVKLAALDLSGADQRGQWAPGDVCTPRLPPGSTHGSSHAKPAPPSQLLPQPQSQPPPHLWFCRAIQTHLLPDSQAIFCPILYGGSLISHNTAGRELCWASTAQSKRRLTKCRLALLFDLLQNNASAARQSNLDLHKSAGQLALERPLQTAVLLSLCGVRCVVLHQWHSNPRTHVQNMAALLDGLLGAGLPSGQALHGLRKGDMGPCGAPESNDPWPDRCLLFLSPDVNNEIEELFIL